MPLLPDNNLINTVAPTAGHQDRTGPQGRTPAVLKDNGRHGVEAVLVTMGLLNCDLAEAQRAFANAPCRDAERRFHNDTMNALAEATDHDA
ncbi:hypothetical protein ABT040_20650 [Streptomyces sp. NPDC002688]|uniref:hypothetical protein n=1 Tax=Streptomyces sp. NPDC002688 TaxID=3154423 RepID=UPI0033218850